MITHDQLAHEAAFEQRQRDYYTEQALKDCTEAVDHADNEVTAKILADIGNLARWLLNNGDLDDGIELIPHICELIDRLINKYANDQARHDAEHQHDH